MLHYPSFCVHTRGDGLTKERIRSEMNEQIRNLFGGHRLQCVGVEMLTRGKALISTFVRNDELFG